MNLTQNVNTLIQQILPAHPLSRLAGKLALCENQQIKNFLIQKFIKHFNVSMDEPGCAVLDAVEKGNVSRRRLESFQRILDTLTGGDA